MSTGMSLTAAATENALRWKLSTVERQLRNAREALSKAETTRDAAKQEANALRASVDQREVEVEQLRADIVDTRSQWATRTKRLQERVAHMSFLEESIADMMVELSQRSVETTAVPAAFDQSRDKFLSQVQSDHVVAVEHLQTMIRMHLAFRDDFQDELRKAVDGANKASEQALVDKNDEIAKLVREQANAKALAQTLKKYQVMAADADAARDAVIAESRTNLGRARDETRAMSNQLQQARLKIDVLENAAAGRRRAAEAGDSKELQAVRLLELKEEVAQAKHREQLTKRKLINSHNLAMKDLKKQLTRLGDVERERDGLQRALKEAQVKIKALRSNHALKQQHSIEAQLQTATRRLEATQTELEKTKAELHKRKQLSAVQDDKMAKMRRDYNRFNKLLQEEVEVQAVPRDKAVVSELAAGNSHYAEFYRKRLQVKEREVTELNKRVRRLIVTQTQQVATISQLEDKVNRQARDMVGLKQTADAASLKATAAMTAGQSTQRLRPHSAVPLRRASRSAASHMRSASPEVEKPHGEPEFVADALGDAEELEALGVKAEVDARDAANDAEFQAAMAEAGVDEDDSDESSDDGLAGLVVLQKPKWTASSSRPTAAFSVRATKQSADPPAPNASQLAAGRWPGHLTSGRSRKPRPHSAVARFAARSSSASRSAPHLSSALASDPPPVADEDEGDLSHLYAPKPHPLLPTKPSTERAHGAARRALAAAHNTKSAMEGVQSRLKAHQRRLGAADAENAPASGSGVHAVRKQRPHSAVMRRRSSDAKVRLR